LGQEKDILEESLRNSKAKLVEVTMQLDIQKVQTSEQQKLREKLGKYCDELENSEKGLKKKFDKLKQKNLELVAKISELHNENSELTEGNSKLVGKVNDVKGELLESRNNENIWEMKFESEKKSYDKLESDFFSFSKENQKLRSELEEAKAKISQFENEKIETNWASKILQSEKSDLEKTILDLKDSLKSLQQDSTAKNTQDLQLATQTVTAHDEKISDLEKNLAATQKSLDERSSLSKDLKKSHKTLQNDYSTLSLLYENLQNESSVKQNQISGIEEIKSILETKNLTLQKDNQSLTSKNRDLKSKNQSISDLNASQLLLSQQTQNTLKQSTAKLLIKDSEIFALQKKQSKADSQQIENSEKIRNFEVDEENFKNQIKWLEKLKFDSESMLAEYDEKFEGLCEANLEVAGERDDMVRRLEGVIGKLEKVKKENFEGVGREKKLRDNVLELEGRVDGLERGIGKMKSGRDGVEEELRKREDEILELEGNLDVFGAEKGE
jgi:chromosome segregation ATPase